MIILKENDYLIFHMEINDGKIVYFDKEEEIFKFYFNNKMCQKLIFKI
jgi:hypothetical protein